MENESIHREVEDFLYLEAELLDAWKLEEWLALFMPEGSYLVPSGDLPDDALPEASLFYIADDPVLLRERVKRLYKKNAFAEQPHSRTRHFISNIRVVPAAVDGEIAVRCAFITHRHRSGVSDSFIGSTQYRLVRQDGALRILEKRCKLDFDNLHEQGRISILL